MRDDDRPLDRGQRNHLAALLAVVLTAVLVVSTCGSCARWQRGRTAYQMHYSTVTLRVTCPGGLGAGSGVVVARDRVLTAAHVVRCRPVPGLNLTHDPIKVEVSGEGDDWVPARVVRYDETPDLAVVEADVGKYHTDVVYGPRPNMGDQACASTGAFPGHAIKCGVVQPSSKPAGTIGDIGIYTTIEYGNSGSGVYDYHGRLVGIVVKLGRCVNDQFCRGYATSIWSHREWLTAP